MITLKVEDYCHNCPHFEADVYKTDISYDFNDYVIHETKVYCKRREACESIYESIKKEMSK